MTLRRPLALIVVATLALAACKTILPPAPTQTADSQEAMTPDAALQMLEAGNARFVAGKRQYRDFRDQVRATDDGQYPFAAIVACVDSRVSPEIIFDQGIGDIYTERNAGNYVDDGLVGGMEYAVLHKGIKLIVVVGHSDCGAIEAACRGRGPEKLLAELEPAVALVAKDDRDGDPADDDFVRRVSEKNIRLSIQRILEQSPELRDMSVAAEIKLVGAMYDVHTGEVAFFQ